MQRSFVFGHTLNRPVEQRLAGSLALAALAVSKGACILRVHDVAETVDVVRMIAAVKTAK
jgi:dihydropteroate synthase